MVLRQKDEDLSEFDLPTIRRTLIIVRHARTEWNEEGRYQGHLDSPVTEYGRQQIAAATERLRGEKIAAVFTSDLGRSVLTADRIARAVHAPVVVDVRLRERSFGIFEGLTHRSADERYPEIVHKMRKVEESDFAVPGGEDKRQVHERVMPAIYGALRYAGAGDIILVGHGSLIRVFLNYVTGQTLPSNENKVPRNCSISIVEYDHGSWEAKIIGDDSHLPVLA